MEPSDCSTQNQGMDVVCAWKENDFKSIIIKDMIWQLYDPILISKKTGPYFLKPTFIKGGDIYSPLLINNKIKSCNTVLWNGAGGGVFKINGFHAIG